MSDRVSCFVMMPYTSESDDLYAQAIMPALSHLHDTNVLTLRADTMGRVQVTLRAHIEGALRAADFCIADVSAANANVMYELGYAVASRKPLVLICEESASVPVSIHEFRRVTYRRNELAQFREQLVRACEAVVQSLPRRSASEQVLGQEAHSGNKAAALVRGLLLQDPQTFTVSVRSVAFLTRELVPQIVDLTRKGLVARIVCADPESDRARLAAEELDTPVFEYRDHLRFTLRELLNTLRRLSGGERSSLEVRIIDFWPTSDIYLTEKAAVFIPWLRGQSPRMSRPAISVAREDLLYQPLLGDLEYAWRHAARMEGRLARTDESDA